MCRSNLLVEPSEAEEAGTIVKSRREREGRSLNRRIEKKFAQQKNERQISNVNSRQQISNVNSRQQISNVNSRDLIFSINLTLKKKQSVAARRYEIGIRCDQELDRNNSDVVQTRKEEEKSDVVIRRTVAGPHPEDSFVHWSGGPSTKTIEIREINWATHFLPKIDPAAKGKELLVTFERPNPFIRKAKPSHRAPYRALENGPVVKQQAPVQNKEKQAPEDQTTNNEETSTFAIVNYTQDRAEDTTNALEFSDVAHIAAQTAADSLSRSNSSFICEDLIKDSTPQFKKVFYRNLDDLLDSMNLAQTSMESFIVQDMNANHQRLSDEVNTLCSQMAEVVDCLKELSDSKKE
ncbi:hypothetical protein F511_13309 [Dorcoceras hygrometricum]|uniref:Uncharacterized protein n=1 Tax=Dorcoceras hygrometricum TaxID=472368 RepID=A0A2Z7DFH6_9LAMI|nr:hypothetical protein F511_13309 [Dorcoceras hygrometricum]